MRVLLFILAVWCGGTGAAAADDGLLGGLVVNQTATRFGQDFYVQFVKYWNEYQIVGQVNLTVRERPSARWGSMVWIEYRNRPVFQQNIGANMRSLDDMARYGAARVFEVVLQDQSAFNGDSHALEDDGAL